MPLWAKLAVVLTWAVIAILAGARLRAEWSQLSRYARIGAVAALAFGTWGTFCFVFLRPLLIALGSLVWCAVYTYCVVQEEKRRQES